MKLQLFMIIAVVVSSLMTISQRVYAHETNQFRWLEPTLEQQYDKEPTTDQNNGSDNGCIALTNVNSNRYKLPEIRFVDYKEPAISRVSRTLIPRAPPVLSI